jgi:hypothetical protein
LGPEREGECANDESPMEAREGITGGEGIRKSIFAKRTRQMIENK